MSQRLDMLERVIAAGSDDPFHWYARAMEFRSLGRLQEAQAAYEAVADRFAAYVPTYLMAGQLAAELGQTDIARQWLTRGITAAAKAGDAHAQSELRSALAALEGSADA